MIFLYISSFIANEQEDEEEDEDEEEEDDEEEEEEEEEEGDIDDADDDLEAEEKKLKKMEEQRSQGKVKDSRSLATFFFIIIFFMNLCSHYWLVFFLLVSASQSDAWKNEGRKRSTFGGGGEGRGEATCHHDDEEKGEVPLRQDHVRKEKKNPRGSIHFSSWLWFHMKIRLFVQLCEKITFLHSFFSLCVTYLASANVWQYCVDVKRTCDPRDEPSEFTGRWGLCDLC